MKKLVASMIFFAFLTTFGQNEKPTIFGVKVGFNNSIVRGHELDGDKTGYDGYEFYAGFFADSKLNKSLNLEYELIYSYTDLYYFIEIPLHLKFNIVKKWNIFAGTKIDLIINDDNSIFESQYKFRNFGVSGEIGMQYLFTPRFLIEIRYSNSFVKQINDFGLEILNAKRNTFRIGVGFRF